MSVVRADSVGPSAGGTTRALVRGTAAAWVNFNGTGTIASRDSENVSSLTDNGTGSYTVNFSNAFGAADYSATLASIGVALVHDSVAPTVGAFQIYTYNSSFSLADYTQNNSIFAGDLA
jgi:hypothetical protein